MHYFCFEISAFLRPTAVPSYPWVQCVAWLSSCDGVVRACERDAYLANVLVPIRRILCRDVVVMAIMYFGLDRLPCCIQRRVHGCWFRVERILASSHTLLS